MPKGLDESARLIPSPPPLVRDPWAWVSAVSVLALVLHSLGGPLGEAVAEDFDHLRHVLLLGPPSLLDGGGSKAFWRPMAHQLYYLTLGPLILAHPRVVVAIHAALLASSALLLYRVFRSTWSGPRAAAAASFPMLIESARTLISWPSAFADLGTLFFSALALHEASRRRMATSMTALLASLLCKEVAVVTAALIPLVPGIGNRGKRIRFALAAGLMVAAWAVAYFVIRTHAGLALPHHLEEGLREMKVPAQSRLAWAVLNSLRAIVSLPMARAGWEGPYDLAWLALAVGALGCWAASARARARIRFTDPWVAWGLSWFLLSSAALAVVYPLWAPYRSVFSAVGLGVALVGLAGALHPVLLAALVALRLVGFVMSPGPPSDISVEAPHTGAFIDFERQTRLQRLMADVRGTLRTRFPTLPRGSHVGQNNFPRNAVYALGGDRALQVWYRDTTLRWVGFEDYGRRSNPELRTIVQFEPNRSPSVALVDPAAMGALTLGTDRVSKRDWRKGLAEFTRAESLQTDSGAVVFLSWVASQRAVCLMELGDHGPAVEEAHRSVGLWYQNLDARYVLAEEAFEHGRTAEARARLDTLLRVSPGDRRLLELSGQIRKARVAAP